MSDELLNSEALNCIYLDETIRKTNSTNVIDESNDIQWSKILFDFPLSNFFYQHKKLSSATEIKVNKHDCVIVNLDFKKSNDITLNEIVFENLFSRISPVKIIYRNLTEDIQMYYRVQLEKRNHFSAAKKLIKLFVMSDFNFRSHNHKLVQYLQNNQLLIVFKNKLTKSSKKILHSLDNKTLSCHIEGEPIFLKLNSINKDIISALVNEFDSSAYVKQLSNNEIICLLDKLSLETREDYTKQGYNIIKFKSACVFEEFQDRLVKTLKSQLKESHINAKNYLDFYLDMKVLNVLDS